MGRPGYPSEFRRKVLDLVEAGRPIAEVAQALGISGQSIYSWRRQDRIDRGLEPGLTSGEKAELVVASAASPSWSLSCTPPGGRWSWSERWCPQKAVRGGQGDGRRAHPGRGRLARLGRLNLWLLRQAVAAAVGQVDPPRLAHRPHRRGPPGLSRHLRRPVGPCRAAPWPRGRGRPQRRRVADAPRRPRRGHRSATWRHAKPDQIAADLIDRAFTRSGPNPGVGDRHRAPRGADEPRGGARPSPPGCRSSRVKLGAA
jgi:hypothetical protein